MRLGRYELGDKLGVGAMGTVYTARDESLGREVAVKTLRTAGRSAFQREVFLERFDHEARALAALSHPNVVDVFDVGVDDETPYLVMELVSGRSLAERIAGDGPLDHAAVHALGYQIASALAAAHDRSIIHRDVKPANILEASPGHWKLADFGVAHVPNSSLTLTGQFLGSPAYAAPEVFAAGAFGPASDVYSLGATLYEALTGEAPHGAGGLLGAGLLSDGGVAAELPDLPVELGRALAGALERDANKRIGARELASILAPAPPRSAWRGAALAAGVVMLVVGIAVGASLGSGEPPRETRGVTDTKIERERARERPPLDERSAKKNEKDWGKVEKELRKGRPERALKHLDKILGRDPGDREARRLYREIDGREWADDGDD